MTDGGSMASKLNDYTRQQLELLIGYDKDRLMAIVHAASSGKKWACGAAGNGAVAERIQVSSRGLEFLIDACWFALAHHGCEEGDQIGRSAYRHLTANMLKEVPPGVIEWAETVEWK